MARSGEVYIPIYIFVEKEDEINDLRHFVFDENPDEQCFFRFKTAEELVSYPKE